MVEWNGGMEYWNTGMELLFKQLHAQNCFFFHVLMSVSSAALTLLLSLTVMKVVVRAPQLKTVPGQKFR